MPLLRASLAATAIVLALAGIGSLSACAEKCPMGQGTAVDLAAHYPEFTTGGYGLPLDTWTENSDLAGTVGGIIEREGVGALTAKYRMQCLPRPVEAGCKECLTCTRTTHLWRVRHGGLMVYVEWAQCLDFGEILMQVDIGPGRTVKAMTYWKTSPEAREYKK